MRNPKLLFIWFIAFLLLGCISQQTTVQSLTPTFQTPTALQTLSSFDTPTASPTETSLPVPTAIATTPFSIDRLRIVLVKDGNLYIQNGTKAPVQLTYSGTDHDPVISIEGNKVAFYRGEGFGAVYSINADGSQEQIIIESQSLPILGQGEIHSLTFQRDTHKLYFNTYLCESSPYLYVYPSCTIGIYSVDADTGELAEIRAGLSGYAGQNRNFELSPNGNFLSIATSGHIDLYYASGDIFYQDAIIYRRTVPNEFIPTQYWLPDSSALIAILPISGVNEVTGPPSIFSASRFQLEGNVSAQIPLEPLIMWNSGCSFSMSPDRNWVFYNSDATDRFRLYLGDLTDGTSRAYDLEWGPNCPMPNTHLWSPDSKYFAFSQVLGSIDGTLVPFSGQFLGWIDDNHYFFETITETTRKINVGEVGKENIALIEGFQLTPAFVLLKSETDQ